jgi:hypothetical protein
LGTCPIDHSVEDVRRKLEEQTTYLPQHLPERLLHLLAQDLDQDTLNDIFHLLKKYDLADDEEQQKRNRQFEKLLQPEADIL